MMKYIIFSIISFILGVLARGIIDIFERKKKYEKIKKLSKQKFENAMKDLEIK